MKKLFIYFFLWYFSFFLYLFFYLALCPQCRLFAVSPLIFFLPEIFLYIFFNILSVVSSIMQWKSTAVVALTLAICAKGTKIRGVVIWGGEVPHTTSCDFLAKCSSGKWETLHLHFYQIWQVGYLGRGTLPTKSHGLLSMWFWNRRKTLHIHFHYNCCYQAEYGSDLLWADSIHQVTNAAKTDLKQYR